MPTYFLSSGNGMFLLRALFLVLETIIEIRGNQFEIKIIFLLVETNFVDFIARRISFFCIVETYFSKNSSFRVVETDFLASTNDLLFFFSEIPAGENFFFYLVEIDFLMNISFGLLEKDFSL